MVAFGAMCTWWDSKDQTASTSKGLPVCPHCRKPLYEETESVFLDGADGHEQDLVDDYKAFILWLRGRPCHTSFADAAKEFIAEAKTKALAEALAAETP